MRSDRAPEAPVVEVRDLTVRYGRVTAVDAVSLAVEPGSVYALLGRNGAGKSSIIACLLGHRRPSVGEARLFGRSAWSERARILAAVGVVPETADAPPSMSARSLGRFSSRLYPSWDGAAYRERLQRLAVPADRAFRRLSRGQRGQVMLSLALAARPRLLLLDDPTLGLDTVARRSVFDELIDELADRGTTVLLTTHDLAGVEGLAERVGILVDGRLVLDEPAESLRGRFRRIEARGTGAAELASSPALARLAAGVVRERSWGVEVMAERFDVEAMAALGAELPGRPLEAVPATLEEIFAAVTGGRTEVRT